MSGGPASPPATPRKPKAVRIALPPLALMHSRHATGSSLRDDGTDKKAKTEKPKKEKRAKGWATVERRRRGGRAKGVRRAEIVDGRGVTTFWSTPAGLFMRDGVRAGVRHGASQREGGSEGAFVCLFVCFLVRAPP